MLARWRKGVTLREQILVNSGQNREFSQIWSNLVKFGQNRRKWPIVGRENPQKCQKCFKGVSVQSKWPPESSNYGFNIVPFWHPPSISRIWSNLATFDQIRWIPAQEHGIPLILQSAVKTRQHRTTVCSIIFFSTRTSTPSLGPVRNLFFLVLFTL